MLGADGGPLGIPFDERPPNGIDKLTAIGRKWSIVGHRQPTTSGRYEKFVPCSPFDWSLQIAVTHDHRDFGGTLDRSGGRITPGMLIVLTASSFWDEWQTMTSAVSGSDACGSR